MFVYNNGTNVVEAVNSAVTLDVTTLDATNIEVTNIKAKDGTASATIANSTGVMTVASSVLTTTDINGGTIDGAVIGGASAAAGNFTTLGATGVATFSAGTVSAPAITTTGDTNTGIFFPAADTIAFTEGGAESMRINSSGNVGIGTDSPTAPLHVNSASNPQIKFGGASAAFYWAFDREDSAGDFAITNANGGAETERMRITAGGNVGIGTTTITSSAGFTPKLVLSSSNAALIVKGQNGQENSFSSADGLYIDSLGNSTAANNIIVFRNTNTNSNYTPTERMRISSAGFVGINNSSPSQYLQVNNGALFAQGSSDWFGVRGNSQSIPPSDNGSNAVLAINGNYTAGAGEINFWNTNTAFEAGFRFMQKTGTSTFNDVMYMKGNGNVGIGTISPGQKLQVAGNTVLNAGGGNTYLEVVSGSSGVQIGTDGTSQFIYGTGNIPLYFATNGSERMRISTTGDVSIGSTSVIADARLNVFQGDSSQRLVHFENTRNLSGDENLRTVLGSNCNDTSSYHYVATTGNDKLYIYGNGNIVNANNSYGALSDESIKENIVDATPKLNSLMGVKIRNFNLIDDDTKTKQIGVVAQELEEVFPSMVELDGKSGKKQVKYSVFVPMLVKAMQEQQAIIENLTTRLNALEGK
jgi:hypothetical protein